MVGGFCIAILGDGRTESLSAETGVMPGPDAGQSSYKRDVNDDDVNDDDVAEAFLRHTSWMDWRHGVPHQRSSNSVLIGS